MPDNRTTKLRERIPGKRRTHVPETCDRQSSFLAAPDGLIDAAIAYFGVGCSAVAMPTSRIT